MSKICLIFVVWGVLSLGCSRKKEVVPEPKVFSYAERKEVVQVEDIRVEEQGVKKVTADFNMDGLMDWAVVNSRPDGQGEISIYIRKPAAPGAAATKAVEYYRAGVIRKSLDGDIIGLLCQKRDKFMDLILLVSKEGQANQMIHYRNDGTTFEEVNIATDNNRLRE